MLLKILQISQKTLCRNFFLIEFRWSQRRCSIKRAILKHFAIFMGKHFCWSLFLIKLQTFRPATLLKRNSNAVAFLWILRNFKEHLFHRTPLDEYLRKFSTGAFLCNLQIFKNTKFEEHLRTTASETCSFSWTSLFDNLYFWLKLVPIL